MITKGQWVIVIDRPPTNPAPPKLSLHWAVPATPSDFPDFAKKVEKRKQHARKRRDENFLSMWNDQDREEVLETYEREIEQLESGDSGVLFDGLFGKEDDFSKSAWIIYKGEKIRLFAREFNPVAPERLRLYIEGDERGETSHEFVPQSEAESRLIGEIRNGDKRDVYDAAQVDGCTPAQAQMVAMGMDVGALDFPPIGWYRCKPVYAHLLGCQESDIAE